MDQKQKPNVGRKYLTGKEAAQLMHCDQRTVYRRVERGDIVASHDRKNKLRIAIDDVHAYLERHPLPEEQVAQTQEHTDCHCQERLETLEQQVSQLREYVYKLVSLITSSSSQSQSLPEIQHFLSQRSFRPFARLSSPEKRHLPIGSVTLVEFARVHQLHLYTLKKLGQAGVIQLSIIHRQELAKRNKQEWWLTPQQQYELLCYLQEQNLPYRACASCPHQSAQGSQADAG